MDKLQQLYDLYIQQGIITNNVSFDDFSSANDDVRSKLYDLGKQSGLFNTTNLETFKSAWGVKKKDELQPTSQEVATESITKEEEPTTLLESSEIKVDPLTGIEYSPSQIEGVRKSLDIDVDLEDKNIKAAINSGVITDNDLVLAGYKEPKFISTIKKQPTFEEREEAKRKISALKSKTSEDIDFFIYQKKLDKPFIYEQYSSPETRDIESISYSKPEEYEGFIDKYFDKRKLEDANINIKDFDGFLEFKGLKKGFLKKSENFKDTYGSKYDPKLAMEMELSRMMDMYIREQFNRDIEQQKLNYQKEVGVNPDFTKDKYSFNVSESNININKVKDYYEENMPLLTKELKDVDRKNKDLYEKYLNDEIGLGYFLSELGNQAYEGFESRLQELSATGADILGFSRTAEGVRIQMDQERLKESDNLSYSYVEGKKVNVNGKNYLVDDNGIIYDTNIKKRVTNFLDEKTKKEIIESPGDKDFSFSTSGTAFESANVLGDMAVQIGLQGASSQLLRGSNLLVGAKRASDISKLIPINREIASSILAQSTLGASTGYENTLRLAREEGIEEKEARKLAREASVQMARLYALTAPISPQTKATQSIFGEIKKNTIREAINSYKKIGRKGFLDVIEKNARKASEYFEEGLKETVQENIQQAGEVLVVNKNINDLAKTKLSQDVITVESFINTSILSFTSGMLMPGAGGAINSSKRKVRELLGMDGVDRLEALSTLSKNKEKVSQFLQVQKDKGIYTQEQVDELISEINIYEENIFKIPDNLSPKTSLEIISDINKISELENKKKTLDPSFHEDIDKEISDIRESIKQKTKEDAIQEQETRDIPDAERAEGVQEMEEEVREPSIEETQEVTITPETSSNYANMTEDGEGNFVFYHVGQEGYNTIEPRVGDTKATSAAERSALSKVGGLAMYYTAPEIGERAVSGNAKYQVKVPVEKVYDFNNDPLNFNEEGRRRHSEENPGKAYDANTSLAYVTKIAGENGFDMVVADWNGKTRAQTTKSLTPTDVQLTEGNTVTKKFDNEYESNAKKGFESVVPESKQSKFDNLYNEIYKERNKESRYDELYFLAEKKGDYTQEQITELINTSDISQEIKDKYNSILESKEGKRRSKKKRVQDDYASKEVDRVKALPTESEDGATMNLDGSKYENGGLVIPVVSTNMKASELTTEAIEEFIEENSESIGADNVKVGIYKFPNSDQVSIDINIVADRSMRAEALKIGKELGQESLFDLDTFENIKTGADGKNPKKLSPKEFLEIQNRLKPKKVTEEKTVEEDGVSKLKDAFNKKGLGSKKQVSDRPSIAEVRKAARENNISDADVKTFLKELGYTQDEISSKNIPSAIEIVERSDKAIKEKFKRRNVKQTMIYLRKKIFDRQTYIKDILKGIGNKKSIRAYNRLVTKAGAKGWANYRFKNAEKEIFRGLSEEEVKNLDALIYARRIVAINENRQKRGLEPYIGAGGYNYDKAKSDVESLSNDKLSKRADLYFKVYNESLKRLFDSGRISEEIYKNLRDIDYSPIKTIKYIIGDNHSSSDMNQLANSIGASQKDIMSLSDENVNDIITDSRWLLMMNINAVENRSATNEILNLFYDAIQSADSEGFEAIGDNILKNPIIGTKKSGAPKFKYDDTKIPTGYRSISFFKNGVEYKMVMKEEYARQLLDVKIDDNTLKKLRKFTFGNVLRFFATSGNPLFIVGNTAVDFQNILFLGDTYSKFKLVGGFELGFDFVKNSIKKMVNTKSYKKTYEEFMMYGGGMDFLSIDGLKAIKSIGSFKKPRTIAQKGLIKWGQALSYLGETSEMAFRLAVYEKTKSKLIKEYKKNNKKEPTGQDLEDILYESARESRETIDFSQGGDLVKSADYVLPYLNASVQGVRKAVDYASKNPGGFASNMVQYAVMSGGLMASSLYMLSSAFDDEDDEEEKAKKMKEAWESVSDYEKSAYHIIFTGDVDENGEYEYYRFKKLPVIGLLSTTVEESIISQYLKSKGVDYNFNKESISKALDKTSPIGITDITSRNPVFSGVLSYVYNRDTFTGEDIFKAPRGKKILPEAEGLLDDKVEQIYKDIAPLLGMSPKRTQVMIEKVITNERTNPLVGIMYGGYNGVFSKETTVGEEMIETGKGVLKSFSSKLKRSTNSKLKEYKSMDEVEKVEAKMETDIYLKEQEVYNEIKDKIKNNEDITSGFLIDIIQEKFERRDWEKYGRKFSTYVKNTNIDRSILDLIYEDTPEVQAYKIYSRYGDSLGEDEKEELIDAMRAAKRKLNKKALYIYNKLYRKK